MRGTALRYARCRLPCTRANLLRRRVLVIAGGRRKGCLVPVHDHASRFSLPSRRPRRAARRRSPERFVQGSEARGAGKRCQRGPVCPFPREGARLCRQLRCALTQAQRAHSVVGCRSRGLVERACLIGMKIRWTQPRSGPAQVFANQGQHFGQRVDLTACSEAQYEIVVGKEQHPCVKSADLFD